MEEEKLTGDLFLYYVVFDEKDRPRSLVRHDLQTHKFKCIAGWDCLSFAIVKGKFNLEMPYSCQLVADSPCSPVVGEYINKIASPDRVLESSARRAMSASKACTEDWATTKNKALEMLSSGVKQAVIAKHLGMSPAMVTKLKKSNLPTSETATSGH